VSARADYTPLGLIAFVHDATTVELLGLVIALDGELRERGMPGGRQLQQVSGMLGRIVRAHSAAAAQVLSRYERDTPREPAEGSASIP
jgi:hypothetical protein